MAREHGLCSLCREVADLCESHIVPEFLYKPLYDDIHRIRVYRSQSLNTPIIQKGLKEYLLCEACEQRLAELENYAASLWQEHSLLPNSIADETYQATGLDYSRFKLFLLSILWRCHVSRQDAFAQVMLGPHADRLRDILLSADIPPWNVYRIFGVVVVDPDTREPDPMFVAPARSKIDGQHLYHMAFGGASWQFIISHDSQTLMDSRCLREDGSMTFSVIPRTEYTPGKRFVETREKLRKQGV